MTDKFTTPALPSTARVDLRAVREAILPLMQEINKRVPPGYLLTLVARNTEFTNCDVVVSQEDDLDKAVQAVRGVKDSQVKKTSGIIMTGAGHG